MDLKFINSEHFFILAACIKECDLEDVYVGDINGFYHYEMFENEDGINSEKDKDLPVLLKF